MKVLVIGGGGREHAIVRGLLRSPHQPDVFWAPANAGVLTPVGGRRATAVDIQQNDLDRLLGFAHDQRIDLTIVGPEEPLCAGIVDKFQAAGLKIFGPSAAAARIEGDKAYAKKLMHQFSVPTADARTFGPTRAEQARARQPSERDEADVQRGYDMAREYIETRESGLVIKATGLARGKGVFVCDSTEEALEAAERLMVQRVLGDAGTTIVVEERLKGLEASVLALVDGHNIYMLEVARDHKRLGDGDTGPNTGGMGAYCSSGLLSDDLITMVQSQVMVPIVDAMVRDETPYCGILYAGLMLTPGGPKVLEFNCRFGDPEAQAVLMRLRSDLLEALLATVEGRLDQITLDWDPRPAVGVVMAGGGYPDKSSSGVPVLGLDDVPQRDDLFVFHAGTRAEKGAVLTNGGRILTVTALGETAAAARDTAYAACDRISFEGATLRRDIAALAG